MEKINWGLLGAGRISGWFAKGLTALPDAARYAIGSRDLEKGRSFAQEFGFEKAYGSYEELVADPAVDVIYIGTPVRTHADCVRLALHAGKPVLCEKTFTVNAGEAASLRDLAKEKGLFLMEAMWMKCQPANVALRDWVREGLLGQILGIETSFYTQARRNHRLFNHDVAGGALLDLTVYPVAAACSLLGHRPTSVHSVAAIDPVSRVDLMESITLSYPMGAYAQITGGLGPRRTHSLLVQGTKGRVLLQEEPFFHMERVTAEDYHGNILAETSAPFLVNGYEFEAAEVMRCLRAGLLESDLVPISETLAVMEILDECRRQWGFCFDFE